MKAKRPDTKRLLVPEVIQTSAMDCGPACLQALLAGFGIPSSYSRLREACQTSIDGTSIDVMEQVAPCLGLEVGQYLIPSDHLFLEEAGALPAIMVTVLPNGLVHFVVVWRTHGRYLQVMDPATGRYFPTRQRFLRELLIHRFIATPAFARRWLRAPAFLDSLRRRLSDLGLSQRDCTSLLDETLAGRGWLPVAALDAATRLCLRLVQTGALHSDAGVTAAAFVRRLAMETVLQGPESARTLIPDSFWSVSPLPNGEVALLGAVVLHANGRTEPEPASISSERLISPELQAVLTADNSRPLRRVFAAAWAENRGLMLALPPALLLSGVASAIEGLLLSGLVHISKAAASRTEFYRALWVVGGFLLIASLLNLSITSTLLRLGRWLDLHLRIHLLQKLPRLGNHYFHSRLKSDLAQRAFGLRDLRDLPVSASSNLRVLSELFVTVAGILWLWPATAGPVLFAMAIIVALPLFTMPIVSELDLRLQIHGGALSRFFLDALQGLIPLRAHRAEEPMRNAHEALLVKWGRELNRSNWVHLVASSLGLLSGLAFAIWMISTILHSGGSSTQVLLAVFWALKLPLLSQSLAGVVRSGPAYRNALRRVFEILDSPEETELHGGKEAQDFPGPNHADPEAPQGGVQIQLRDVNVVAAGNRILSDVNLDLRPGEHVAVVGPSGSGKTSLIGLLLGWHRAESGSVLLDSRPAHIERLRELRRVTAWVDPAVQLWNRSMEQNLRYGNGELSLEQIERAVKLADLEDVVDRLPMGLNSVLGEGGGLISGGEGQRVRLARALLREGVRLAVLDEPFRGLDHDKRVALLSVARMHWRGATMIYVSHDIDTALSFDRIVVIENGRIVEDSAPAVLLADPASRLTALKNAQDALDREIWRSPVWRPWRMDRGELRELSQTEP